MTSINDFRKKKAKKEKIRMVTCYDHWSARLLKNTDIDCLLVGDSVSMVVHGFDSTIHATAEMMALHTQAVARANTQKLIVTDLPFLAHRLGQMKLMSCVDQLMKAGAHALKIEAAPGQAEIVKYISDSGVPMIGHVGLTPQYVNQFGGYIVQGKDEVGYQKILQHSKELQEAGCHALVLECVPSALAEEITDSLDIPTIGIGAGLGVDGQVLVLQDLLGFNEDFQPRFVRHFAKGEKWFSEAIQSYTRSVDNKLFPSQEESFL